MIALLTGWGLTEKVAKLVAYIGIPVVILIAFYMMLSVYGNSRYNAGKADTDAAWKIAHEKLLTESAQAKGAADVEALAREMDYFAEVEQEKEKVDEAIAQGSSPIDVLFGVE